MGQICVRASELPRRFGQLSQAGTTVLVTHHGRETHALLPIASYHAIVAAKDERGSPLEEDSLIDRLPMLLLVVDNAARIVTANRTAHAVLRKPLGRLVGGRLLDHLPLLEGSVFQSYFNRTAQSGEPSSFELSGLFGAETWHRIETYRTVEGVVILAHDITEDIAAHRLADGKKALIDALAMHGGIGHFWLNVRGRIDRCDAAVERFLQLPATRLAGVAIADLVPVGQRVNLRQAIEDVLSGAGGRRLETEFLRNDGETLPMICAITELRGSFRSEGAVMVATRQ
ncbi:PAS domain-containing protein [Sphingomonas sp.]|uniref:PAS domain-containing protein n=1 Tax=Sphingomonas sp. TaxID=28214 RepID=UPI0025F76C05|nr:PAS domain-containing protein [Sphingomonas sp.]